MICRLLIILILSHIGVIMWDPTITQVGTALSGLFNIWVTVCMKMLAFSQSMLQQKHLKKKLSQGYLRLFTIHLGIFQIYFSWNMQKILLFVIWFRLEAWYFLQDWGAWEQSVKESEKVLNGRVSRGVKKITFKPWHSTTVYIKGSHKLKYWVSENFCSQTFVSSILGSDCVLK